MTMSQRWWFGLLAAPGAWIVEGLFGWGAGSRVCTAWSVATARLVIGAFSLVMLAFAAAGLLTGVRNWRTATAAPRAAGDRVEFMSFGGVLVSTAFVIGIIWSGLVAVFIDECGRAR